MKFIIFSSKYLIYKKKNKILNKNFKTKINKILQNKI